MSLFDCTSGTVAFVGSHLDVVPANPETWERNPFKLTVEVTVYTKDLWCLVQLTYMYSVVL